MNGRIAVRSFFQTAEALYNAWDECLFITHGKMFSQTFFSCPADGSVPDSYSRGQPEQGND